ncbi:hypothetical protein D512_00490 [Burkholderia pseudomallei MSHR1043]|uniref:Uncharacterized protein n=1 Tax=Burkholderia pseudomallei 1710a TaxID=320371 RepID=A0A0E1WA59_BURPE|nr:conserved hypothetical protein [Burkholderia pseudomallei MSHR346]ARK97034.1 hypothetical protein BOC43_21975 [Burkholderia pseudomallei]EDS84144.1 hypothetical protein BURPSS13_F0215 [Burkholderia pseudomallei S13]EDU11491.1 hypothetical protein BURPS1655_F0087 [Burkholderia pseudomallei 1655]EET09236.1 conserved hypothetical protein [Burkholderia pseudomallei 1710a]EMP78051.1 hypothetical protein D512_00490 [Burkholderia pseudomallei MSHR1043]EXI99706.1 hypothetical protein T210_0126110 
MAAHPSSRGATAAGVAPSGRIAPSPLRAARPLAAAARRSRRCARHRFGRRRAADRPTNQKIEEQK